MPILQVDRLSKRYGSVDALNELDLVIERGQVFGLLGPNGSGKSTFLAVVLDVIKPTSGTFSWFEMPSETNVRTRIGALLETPNFYSHLDATRNLEIVAMIRGAAPGTLQPILEIVGLSDRARLPFHSYSLGMKQRLALASCLVGDPEVIVLDEPTNGLDPEGIIEVRELIRKIAGRGKTIIMASHMLDEVEKVCSHVAIMKRGQRLAVGPIGSILGGLLTVEVGCAEATMEELRKLLSKWSSGKLARGPGSFFVLELESGRGVEEINRLAHSQGIALNHLVAKQRSLESEFLEITRR